MQQVTMLATAEGDWVLPGTADFFAALGDTEPDYDAVSFAVKNLGFVKLQILQQSIVEVELHPRNVAMPALLAAQQQVLSSRLKLYRIKYFDTEWRSEISSSPEHVIARMSELCAPAVVPPSTDRFVVEPQDFAKIFHDEGNWFRPLALKWRISFGEFDSSIISLAVTHHLLSRLIIVGIRPNRSEPTWRFIGDGHKWIGSNYHFGGIGQNVRNMPDRDYGDWVAEYYKSVAMARQPRYDLITAAIRYEDEDGRPVRLRRYERLMLPWKTTSEEVFVTMCSKRVDEREDEASSSRSLAEMSPDAMKLARAS
jgi:hypothetical protein